uniref:ATP synthase subunit 8 n=1 Tax=Phascolopsis gouldii TaxID=6442 RepID=Q952F2_PHAGO|nr:ATP synthase subunit 8 [Phascolopsis gouldii]
MPHLAPMPWLLIALLFWLFLILLVSTFWWHQSMHQSFSALSLPKPLSRQWPW